MKSKKYIRSILLFIAIVVTVISFNNVLANSYIYDIKSEESGKKTAESSISTIASPEFTFQSEAQVLMEPITGKILYENNADEHLLPASVTKIMTMLLTMEHIDSR